MFGIVVIVVLSFVYCEQENVEVWKFVIVISVIDENVFLIGEEFFICLKRVWFIFDYQLVSELNIIKVEVFIWCMYEVEQVDVFK